QETPLPFWRMKIHLVSSTDSPEFTFLSQSLTGSSIIGLDAEWKRTPTHQSSFPTVTLLQAACRRFADDGDESPVFLIDLLSIRPNSIWEMLRDVFVSPNVLKLGFRFKQDLVYLPSTFCSHGCDPGFDKHASISIRAVYRYIGHLTILFAACKCFILFIVLINITFFFQELQCSDWSCRPLTEEQKIYAAMDALCLLDIFIIFEAKISNKVILKMPEFSNNILKKSFCEASDMIRVAAASECPQSMLCGLMVHLFRWRDWLNAYDVLGLMPLFHTQKKPDTRQLIEQASREKEYC
ncbi:3'-5' exonuclease domain, partial [Dillenia turbinata]